MVTYSPFHAHVYTGFFAHGYAHVCALGNNTHAKNMFLCADNTQKYVSFRVHAHAHVHARWRTHRPPHIYICNGHVYMSVHIVTTMSTGMRVSIHARKHICAHVRTGRPGFPSKNSHTSHIAVPIPKHKGQCGRQCKASCAQDYAQMNKRTHMRVHTCA